MARDILAELGLPPPPQAQQMGQQGESPPEQMPQEAMQQQMQPGMPQQAPEMQQAQPQQQIQQQIQNIEAETEEQAQGRLDQLMAEHPVLGRIGMWLTKHPELQQAVQQGGAAAQPINEAFEASGIPAFAGGALQEVGNMGISAANLIPKAFGSDKRIEHLDLEQYLKDPSLWQTGMFHGGRVAGGIGVGGAASKAANLLGRPAGALGIATDVAKGAGLGYALGENPEHEGRITGALIGGVLAPLARSTNKGISQTVREDAKALRGKYNNLYEGLFKEAEQEGLDKGLKVAKQPANSAFHKIDSKFTEAYNAAVESPTLRNIHKAQSKLGQYIARQENTLSKSGYVSEEALNLARKMEGQLESQVGKTLSKSKSGLSNTYNTIQEGYAKEAAPLLKNSIVGEHVARRNPSSVDRFIKQIGGESKAADLFTEQLGGKYGAQMGINKLLGKAKVGALDLAKIGIGGALLKRPIHNYMSSMFEGYGGGGSYGE